MKFSVLQENLQQSLGFLQKAIPSRPALPILSSILLEVDDKTVTLSATDLYFGVQAKVPTKIEKSGVSVIPGKQLKDIIQSLSAGLLDIELSDTQLTITSPSTTSALPAQSSEEFPPFPQVEGDQFTLSKDILLFIKNYILKSASTDVTRPVLTGVLLSFSEKGLTIASTDGFRLSLYSASDYSGPEATFIIPSKVLEEVSRIAEVQELAEVPFTISTELQQVFFSLGEVSLFSRLIDGEYPPYEKIIPSSSSTELVVDPAELQEQIKRAQIFSKDFSSVVQLVYDQEQVIVKASSSTSGSFEGKVSSGKITGEDGSIAFIAKYLLDFLQTVKSDQITISLSGDQKPAVLTSTDLPHFKYIVMPFRIHN